MIPIESQLQAHLTALRLEAFAESYQIVADQCGESNRSYLQYLAILAEQEVNRRTTTAIDRRIKAAKFPLVKTLDTFDFTAQPTLKKQQILNLAQCQFIPERSNVIFLGACGTGKTHLCIALGHMACQKGYRVYFDTAAGLINTLIEAQQQYRLAKKLAQLQRFDLIICDELGYIPFDQTGTDLLFQLVAKRYEQGTMMVSTNLPFSEWTTVFHNSATAAAVIDRLVHHSAIIQIQGDSYRLAQKAAQKE